MQRIAGATAHMHTTWQSLAWKEWHEHKWKLVSDHGHPLGRDYPRALRELECASDRLPAAMALVTFCTLPLAVFVGLGEAASEASRQTLPFLQALLTPMHRVAAWKLLFGLVTLFVPVLLAACLIYLWTFGLETSGEVVREVSRMNSSSLTGSWFADLLVIAGSVSASLFIWSAAAGVNRKDEVSERGCARGNSKLVSYNCRDCLCLGIVSKRTRSPRSGNGTNYRVCSFNYSGWLFLGL